MALNNLKKEAYKVRMTPEEKSAMHARIFGVATATPHSSPYFMFSFQFLHTRVLAPLAIVLLVGVGTTYAAEGALPGDTLYPIKTYVNEPVALSLARSPVARAEAHATIAERRVKEAQTLAAEGRLDATTTEELALGVESQIEQAEIEADAAEEAEGGKGAQVRARLAATLGTGARVLAQLGADQASSTKESAESLSVRLLARAEGGAAANAQAFSKAAPAADASTTQIMSLAAGTESTNLTEDPAQQKVAAELEEEASDALKDARKIFANRKDWLTASTTAHLEEEFSVIETSISLGSASLGAGAYAQAEADFTDALRRAIVIEKLLEAHARFNGDVIDYLLGNDEDHDHEEEVHGTSTDGGGESDPTKGELDIQINGEVDLKVIR